MPTRTPNHGYRLFAQGEMPWEHREEFQQLDTEAPIVDTDAARSNYTPKVNALFVAHEGPVYRGDGASWIQIGDLTSSGSGTGTDPTLTEGIESSPRHVGPIYHGEYHGTDAYGVMFYAEAGLQIHSAVVDVDLTNMTTNTFTVKLTHYESGAANPTEVGTVNATVTNGPQRIDLSSLPAIPTTGEYVLARVTNTGGESIPARRVTGTEWGTAAYAEHTYPEIDFRKGTKITELGDSNAADFYYYFFDLEVGDPETHVTSPLSTDVEEIYMRPRPPEEEFGNVSPRSLWIDTSSP